MKYWQLVTLAVVGLVALVPLIWWVLWSLWTWVLPQVWPDGPDAIVRPGYWLFVGELLVLSIIGRTLFSGSKE